MSLSKLKEILTLSDNASIVTERAVGAAADNAITTTTTTTTTSWGELHDMFLQAMKEDVLQYGECQYNMVRRPFHDYGLTTANINAFHYSNDEGHCNLLFHTVKEGNYSVFKYLLEMGADPLLPNNHSTNVLHLIIKKKLSPWIRDLKIESMTKDKKDRFLNCAEVDGGNTPLMSAVRLGSWDITRLLVTNGANVNQQMTTGWSALHMAALRGHLQIAHYLMERGADPLLESTHQNYGKRVKPYDVSKEPEIIHAIYSFSRR